MQGFLNLRKLKANDQGIYSGNRMQSSVEVVETFRLVLRSSFYLDRENTFYVPIFSRNLFSIGRLVSLDYLEKKRREFIREVFRVWLWNSRERWRIKNLEKWKIHQRGKRINKGLELILLLFAWKYDVNHLFMVTQHNHNFNLIVTLNHNCN